MATYDILLTPSIDNNLEVYPMNNQNDLQTETEDTGSQVEEIIQPVDEQGLKKDATETVTQVKDVINNADIKEEANFIKEVMTNPIRGIKSVAASGTSHLPIALVTLFIWTGALFLQSLFRGIRLLWQFNDFLDIFRIIGDSISAILSPILTVIVLSLAVYIFFREKVKGFMPILITITLAFLPRAAGAVLGVIPALIPFTRHIFSPIIAFLSLISTILVYFGLKAFVGEDNDEKFFIGFLKILCVFFIARFILGLFGIGISI